MIRFVVILALFAAVVYATFWIIDRRSQGGGGGGLAGSRCPARPVGPDDDEDFLRELDRKQRHSKDEES